MMVDPLGRVRGVVLVTVVLSGDATPCRMTGVTLQTRVGWPE